MLLYFDKIPSIHVINPFIISRYGKLIMSAGLQPPDLLDMELDKRPGKVTWATALKQMSLLKTNIIQSWTVAFKNQHG